MCFYYRKYDSWGIGYVLGAVGSGNSSQIAEFRSSALQYSPQRVSPRQGELLLVPAEVCGVLRATCEELRATCGSLREGCGSLREGCGSLRKGCGNLLCPAGTCGALLKLATSLQQGAALSREILFQARWVIPKPYSFLFQVVYWWFHDPNLCKPQTFINSFFPFCSRIQARGLSEFRFKRLWCCSWASVMVKASELISWQVGSLG
jgi:hypothetical protein